MIDLVPRIIEISAGRPGVDIRWPVPFTTPMSVLVPIFVPALG